MMSCIRSRVHNRAYPRFPCNERAWNTRWPGGKRGLAEPQLLTVSHALTRAVILVLSLAGFAGDGLQITDAYFAVALVLWLWMPACVALEARLLRSLFRSAPDDG